MMSSFKRRLIILVIFLGVLSLLYISGPRLDMSVQLTPIDLPPSLDDYIQESESRFSDITPGAEKSIVWAAEPDTRTEYAVVYLHGFSATRQESAPVAERIAEALGANVFNTRFAGHGRGGDAMIEGSLNRWLNDTREAMAIGRRLGDKIILLGVSTGGTAAVWAALNDSEQLAALVLMSPNFGPKDGRTTILTWPWGKQVARLMVGPERSWTPQNDGQARYWTTRYPTEAMLPMMAMVKTIEQQELSTIQTPSLWIYSESDEVLNVAKIERAYREVGSGIKQSLIINDSEDPSHHVLAGDILSPSKVSDVVETVLRCIATIN